MRIKMESRLLSLLILIGLVITNSTFAADKPLVAVMDFENKSQYGGYRVGQGASDMLATELVKSKTFRVVERDKINTLLKEQDFSNTDRVDASTATQIGKVLGVKYIITGAVTEYGQSKSGGGGGGVRVGKTGYFSAVDIRVLDGTTGEIVFADSGEGEKSSVNVKVLGIGGGESFNEKHATAAMREAIQDLIGKLKTAEFKATPAAPAGPAMVADVDGNNIMINQGSGAGYKTGQTLDVVREDRVVKDPTTGKVLTVKYKTVGKIKITNVESGYAEATVVSGSGFQVGDAIQ